AYAPDASVFEPEYLAEKLETKAGWSRPAPTEELTSGHYEQAQDFVSAVAEGRPSVSDGRLGRDVVEVIYAAYLSAEEGRRVNLPVIAAPPM
ncbi:MAG: gfo/Idh/MocA family oxidoreductase, partial [Chloroflexota bacterium]|nr:gfo/Idh/MocA family oxidoreductase [Chloroflexota bacterium]